MKPSVAAARQTAAAEQIAAAVDALHAKLDALRPSFAPGAASPPMVTAADLARVEAKLDQVIAALDVASAAPKATAKKA